MVLKSFWWYFNTRNFIYFLCCQKLKQVWDLHTNTNLQQIHFPTSNYSSSSVFQTSRQVQKNFLYFKFYLTMRLQTFHLIFQLVQCNEWHAKRQISGQEANRIPQVPSLHMRNILKSCLWIDISTWQYLSEKISKDEIQYIITDQHFQVTLITENTNDTSYKNYLKM